MLEWPNSPQRAFKTVVWQRELSGVDSISMRFRHLLSGVSGDCLNANDYGHYAGATRARRRKIEGKSKPAEGLDLTRDEAMPSSAESRWLRRGWAQLIRRVCEVDPLLCRVARR